MLLDEPLTNLDANLREEMRFEIVELQKRTASTILYVTHDQEVALAISDRMAVMDAGGRIRQLGTPEEIYERPVDEFVYTFLGVANFLPAQVEGGKALVDEGRVALPACVPSACAGGSYRLGCRPMDVILARRGENPGAVAPLAGRILRTTLLGPIVDFLVEVAGVSLRAQMQTEEAVAKDLVLAEGSQCRVGFADLKWFGSNGEAVR
jgi:iron(III) transport system ATP-binding protein